MFLTVAICTWNRADLLRLCLERLTSLEIPPDVTWELIIVNNACTDATDDVIEQLSDRLPIRRVYEPTPGISNARNAAVREAQGEFILWTDDDVLLEPKWMRAYVEAIARHPDAAVFGGPIRPSFDEEPPPWILEAWSVVADAFASRDLGDAEQVLSRKAMPYGANFVVRTRNQREHRYDPHLGKTMEEQKAGEELAVMRAILDEGERGWWIPDAIVYHIIPAERVSLAFLKKWYTDLGRTSAIFLRERGKYNNRVRMDRLRRFVIARTRLLWRRWTSNPAVWMEDFRTSYVSLGYLKS